MTADCPNCRKLRVIVMELEDKIADWTRLPAPRFVPGLHLTEQESAIVEYLVKQSPKAVTADRLACLIETSSQDPRRLAMIRIYQLRRRFADVSAFRISSRCGLGYWVDVESAANYRKMQAPSRVVNGALKWPGRRQALEA